VAETRRHRWLGRWAFQTCKNCGALRSATAGPPSPSAFSTNGGLSWSNVNPPCTSKGGTEHPGTNPETR
jgi:hypothetical protein